MLDYLKLKWEGKNVNVSVGENFNAEVDTEALAGALDAFSATGSAIGTIALTKFFVGASAATIATFIGVRFINKTWPWLKAQLGPEDDMLQISVPDGKAADLNKLIESGDLEKRLQEEIKQPRKALEDDLGDKDTKMIDQLAEQLEKIQLASVTKCTDVQRHTTGKVIHGTYKEEAQDRVSIVTPAKGQQGNVTGMVVGKGATAEIKERGGIDIVGGDSDLAKYAMDIAVRNMAEVAVKFSDRSERFVRKYKLHKTIYDVIADIIKDTGKQIKHILNTKTKEIEDEDTEVSTLQGNGHLKSLMAVIE